jgi:hypothetical protein
LLTLVNGALRSRAAVQGRSSAAVQLEHAKKAYLSFSSKLYPTWKEQSTFKKMNTLKTLQQEKEEAEKRRLVSSFPFPFLYLNFLGLEIAV